MATWHQEKNQNALREMFAPDATKWKCVSGDRPGQFAGCIKFLTQEDAEAYSAKTGDRIIPPSSR